MNQKLLLFGAILLILVGVGSYVLGTKKAQPVQTNSLSVSPTAVTSNEMSDETANWKMYTTTNYSLKYPTDWILTESDYLNTRQITNPSKTVYMLISEGQYPFGFGNSDTIMKQEDLNLKVGENEYSAKEITVNNSSIYVNLELDTQKNHYLLFGTGYPAGDDSNKSLDDYFRSKNTIFQILSTFKFTE